MRVLCDVNLLVALVYEGHEHHRRALRWLVTQNGSGSLVVCRVTHLSLLRLLNNPAVLGRDACSGKQVWELSDQLLFDERFTFGLEPHGIEQTMRGFTSESTFTAKIWQDAYLAAFAIQARFSLATFDKGFAKFHGLSLALIG